MSKIEDIVIDKIRSRAEIGEKKYKTTMEREDLSLHQWMTHLQEELLDASVYLQKCMDELRDRTEDFMADRLHEYDEDAEKRMDIIGRNGNTGDHYDALNSVTMTDYPTFHD